MTLREPLPGWSRAELWCVAYLFTLYGLAEEAAERLMRALFAAYDSPAGRKLHELSLRPSPMMQRLRSQ